MRVKLVNIVALAIILSCAHTLNAVEHSDERIERTAAVQSHVSVWVCLASGNIIVHGWDRREVRARSDAQSMELRGNQGANAASHLEVFLSDGSAGFGSCGASNDIELDVPRDAVLQLRDRDGSVQVEDVAEAHAQTECGDIQLDRISGSVDAGTISGDISLKNSSGPINLHSISGSVQAVNVRPVNAGDDFQIRTVSGDIMLDHVGQTRVEGATVSGSMIMTGPLARAGHYGFKSMSGDVTLNLPTDSSFQINARISREGEVTTDFPLKLAGRSGNDSEFTAPEAPDPNKSGEKVKTWLESSHFAGVYGTGDASINLFTFSGTVYLRRK